MTRVLVISAALVAVLGCKDSQQSMEGPNTRVQEAYVITEHKVLDLGLPTQEDDYTVTYGSDVMKVKYASSQTSSAKPGDFPGTGLHLHQANDDPDLTQVPQVGEAIRQCKLSKDTTSEGAPIIARQSTSAPCMNQFGDQLEYSPSPNAGDFTYVIFDILCERMQ